MALGDEIAPAPKRGSVLELDAFAGTWTPQPPTGSVLELDAYTGFDPPRRGGWSIGMVRGGRG